MSTIETISVVDTAKLVRARLRTGWGDTKFSVRTERYAGGQSITVRWVDGPDQNAVQTYLRAWQGAGFDGMTDSQYSVTSWLCGTHCPRPAHADGGEYDGPQSSRCCPDARLVRFGADYVTAARDISPEFRAKVADRVRLDCGLPADAPGHTHIPVRPYPGMEHCYSLDEIAGRLAYRTDARLLALNPPVFAPDPSAAIPTDTAIVPSADAMLTLTGVDPDAQCDRDGSAVSRVEGERFASAGQRGMRETVIIDAANPARSVTVSTVWMGLDHAEDHPAPLIFETMVFGADDTGDVDERDQLRYPTEVAARDGHRVIVGEWVAGMVDPVVIDLA